MELHYLNDVKESNINGITNLSIFLFAETHFIVTVKLY